MTQGNLSEVGSGRNAIPGVTVLLALFGCALAVRIAFVAWAPGELSGDDKFYQLHARYLMQGKGYVNPDGSPAVRWMPGWPIFLSLVYAAFGYSVKAGMIANAFLGGVTTVLVAALGGRLFDRATGTLAGGLHVAWPGIVYFSATLFVETLFTTLLAATLLLLASGALASRHRTWLHAGAGLALGLCAMVKAEPTALLPVVLVFVWLSSGRVFQRFALDAGALIACLVLVLAPWTIRNYQLFGRFMPTSASGGTSLYVGNHEGATGGNAPDFVRTYTEEFRDRPSNVELSMAKNDAAWGRALQFVRDDPSEAGSIMLHKIWLTYRGDHQGATQIRGFAEGAWNLAGATWQRLAILADVYWFAMLGLALIGCGTSRSWRGESRVLIFGTLATWLALHVIFIGNMRFHFPEVPLIAVLAALGIQTLRPHPPASGPGDERTEC